MLFPPLLQVLGVIFVSGTKRKDYYGVFWCVENKVIGHLKFAMII